jgi:23S rRNA (uracil1939-C5)-methyltransferase
VDPPCPYSGYCGGCKWQFIDYPYQLELKRRHVAESLEHIAMISGTTVHPTLPSDRVFGYRNKMEFSCSDRRWLMPHEMGTDADISFALGLHVPGTFHKVLDTRACLLQPETGNRILQAVRILHAGLGPAGLRAAHPRRLLAVSHAAPFGGP